MTSWPYLSWISACPGWTKAEHCEKKICEVFSGGRASLSSFLSVNFPISWSDSPSEMYWYSYVFACSIFLLWSFTLMLKCMSAFWNNSSVLFTVKPTIRLAKMIPTNMMNKTRMICSDPLTLVFYLINLESRIKSSSNNFMSDRTIIKPVQW